MKRKILVITVVAGLVALGGLTVLLSSNFSASTSTNQHLEEDHSGHEMELDTPVMDPDMPGMDHSISNHTEESQDRPLKEVLGAFGIATSFVLTGAIIVRRRDKIQREIKAETRKAMVGSHEKG